MKKADRIIDISGKKIGENYLTYFIADIAFSCFGIFLVL